MTLDVNKWLYYLMALEFVFDVSEGIAQLVNATRPPEARKWPGSFWVPLPTWWPAKGVFIVNVMFHIPYRIDFESHNTCDARCKQVVVLFNGARICMCCLRRSCSARQRNTSPRSPKMNRFILGAGTYVGTPEREGDCECHVSYSISNRFRIA